ncbi:LysR family transcriptional regulator [Sulfuriflexus mobilis]|uniref:LysR family transcriptional regulator n=1 Tax=Sulfuriflexus mobilis TaxID=1811807 RepID=UPI000F8206F7|nr:LysR family transcriptional regulator [Sulfuriflexus mobilis]
MDIEILRTFVEVMRRCSFAAVAREKDVAPSSISRAISSLEEELGVRLFQRSTRRLEPTEAGIIYYEHVEPLVDELERAHSMAADLSEHPRGTLRITTPVTFGQITLIPLLPELSTLYPDLTFEISMDDHMVDLLSERIDVALRLGPLTDSSFVATQLCELMFVVCASPAYIKKYGRPETLANIEQHNCLLFPLPGYSSRWRFRDKTGRVYEVPVHGRCYISNAFSLKQSAMADMGLVLLPRWVVWQELENGSLVDLFPDYDVTATEFDSSAWLLYPSRSYLPLKVRVFVNFMKDKFRAGLPWE